MMRPYQHATIPKSALVISPLLILIEVKKFPLQHLTWEKLNIVSHGIRGTRKVCETTIAVDKFEKALDREENRRKFAMVCGHTLIGSRNPNETYLRFDDSFSSSRVRPFCLKKSFIHIRPYSCSLHFHFHLLINIYHFT